MGCSIIIQTTAVPATPPAPTGGCGNCWAAGYCAAYVPGSTQVPPNCPLGFTSEPAGPPPIVSLALPMSPLPFTLKRPAQQEVEVDKLELTL
ncbi:MAG: hypothetical protein EOO63_17135 [Hymenobacter sp.]|nr:MAG: hypothetical protein EOO63_17135 [Hymenobacter sp.]